MSCYLAKKVLVTGGLGFIGSNLANRLVSMGAEVTILDSMSVGSGANLFNVHDIRSVIKLIRGNICDTPLISDLVKDKDYIFNLASQTSHIESMRDPQTDLENNVVGQISLLGACVEFNPSVHVIYTSTRQLYGKPNYLPVDEEHPVRPTDANGINKYAAEQYHRLYADIYNLPVTILGLPMCLVRVCELKMLNKCS